MLYFIEGTISIFFSYLPIIIIYLVCVYITNSNREYNGRYGNGNTKISNSLNNKYAISKEEKEKIFGKDNCHIDENRFGDKDVFDDDPIQDGKKFFLHKSKIKRL